MCACACACRQVILTSLGFENISYTGQTIIAPNLADLSGVKNVFISIVGWPKRVRTPSDQRFNFMVPICCKYGSIIFGQGGQLTKLGGLNIKNITQLQIRLTDRDGNLIDLQGLNWNLTLEFVNEVIPQL